MSLRHAVWFALKTISAERMRMRFLEMYGSFEEIYNIDFTKAEVPDEFCGITAALQNKSLEKVDFLLENCRIKSINVISIEDEEYPPQLRHIYNPPLVLYYIGDISLLKQTCITIVGTRDCSEASAKNARIFAKTLAEFGLIVVSGMALGIDGEAHRGALSAGMPTVCILACGVDVCYPEGCRDIYMHAQSKGGLIVSEYPPGTRPDRFRFPQRNRILSGVSSSVLLVEAGEKSGALITANFALDQGKELFVIPSNISAKTAGSNNLIKEGATVVISPMDIISELKIKEYRYVKVAEPTVFETGFYEPKVYEPKRSEAATKVFTELSELEAKIIMILDNKTMHFDEIFRQTDVDITEFSTAITMLLINDVITEVPGKNYRLKF